MSRKERITIGLSLVATLIAIGSIVYTIGKKDERIAVLQTDLKEINEEFSKATADLEEDISTLRKAIYGLREVLLKNDIRWNPEELPLPMYTPGSLLDGLSLPDSVTYPLDFRLNPPTKVLPMRRP